MAAFRRQGVRRALRDGFAGLSGAAEPREGEGDRAITIALIFGLLALGLFLSIPMFVVLIGTAFIVVAATTPIPLSILPQRVFAGSRAFLCSPSRSSFSLPTLWARAGSQHASSTSFKASLAICRADLA